MAKTKPCRPPRLVASKRRAAASNAITALNSANSPLLTLAPEIRNRIYEFALGGNNLHFYGGSKAVQVCANDSTTGWIEVEYRNGQIKRFSETYGRCQFSGRKYSTSLLLVCRQINEEAALIPFATNTFIVDIHNLESLFSELLPAQRKAVASLDLRDNEKTSADRIDFNASMTKQLTGLRDLQISVPRSRPSRQLDTAKVGSALEKLCNGRLETVTVREQRFNTWVSRPRDEFDEWTEQMEGKLLSRTSWSEQRKKVALELEDKRSKTRAGKKAEEEMKRVQVVQASATARARRGLRKLG